MGTKVIKGADISAHQSSIDFKKAKKDGIKFIIPRSSYARTKDKRFEEFVKGAKNAGVEIKGVYVFSYALKSSDATKEAEYCVKLVKKAGLSKDTIIFYDFEYDTVRHGRDHKVSLGPKSCQSFTKAFCKKVKELGYPAGVYSNIDYYNRMYQGKVIGDNIFWLAHYTSGDPWKKCVVHQYTSKGRVNGMSGNIDMNKWYGGVKKDETKPEETKEKEEKKDTTKKKTTTEIAKEVIAGKWGNGATRKKKLEKAGYNYEEVQKKVNELSKKKKG